MSIIYELDFPCGCHTLKHDPREWALCERHPSAQLALVEWAAEGARLFRLLMDLGRYKTFGEVLAIDKPFPPTSGSGGKQLAPDQGGSGVAPGGPPSFDTSAATTEPGHDDMDSGPNG